MHKVRLCHNLRNLGKCKYGDGYMYAHTLKDLQVPDEGKYGEFERDNVWQDRQVHRWYGQFEMPDEFKKYDWKSHEIFTFNDSQNCDILYVCICMCAYKCMSL